MLHDCSSVTNLLALIRHTSCDTAECDLGTPWYCPVPKFAPLVSIFTSVFKLKLSVDGTTIKGITCQIRNDPLNGSHLLSRRNIC